MTRRPTTRGALLTAVAVLVLAATACGGQHAESDALTRGDAAWARGDIEEALAEYRLALRASQDAQSVMRVAHAYAQLGRADDAQPYYRQAVEADPRLTTQAVSDLVMLARTADERGTATDWPHPLSLPSSWSRG